jgi:7-carboxy-7-deazaguanine synthase
MYFKFVVSDSIDVEEVDRAVNAYRANNINVPVYLMPMGGRTEGYNLTVREVAKLAMAKGYRFTPRLHITLFGNAWGT